MSQPQLGQTEIEDFDPVISGDEEVLRFQIAMDDPFLVSGGKPGSYLLRILDGPARRHRTRFQLRTQFLTFEQLHDQIR